MTSDRNQNLAAVLYGICDLRLEQRPVPIPALGEVLVEIRSVGVCGSDVHYYEHGRIGDFVVTAPLILGHESSGVIVAVGDGACPSRIGQRVALEPGIPCGHCRRCRQGRYNLCADVRFFATPPVDGAFVQYVAINSEFAHPLPDSLSDDAGALIEPLAVAVWANRKAITGPGARVLVTGAGPVGVLCALVAQASGAADVAITDPNPDRLAQAEALGIRPVDLADCDPAGGDPAVGEPDILIECSGATSAIAAGVQRLASAGTAVLVGMNPQPAQELPTALIQARELTVTGTFRYANVYPAAIALAASGRVRLDALVGARLPLHDAEDALTMATRDPKVLKTIVVVSAT